MVLIFPDRTDRAGSLRSGLGWSMVWFLTDGKGRIEGAPWKDFRGMGIQQQTPNEATVGPRRIRAEKNQHATCPMGRNTILLILGAIEHNGEHDIPCHVRENN